MKVKLFNRDIIEITKSFSERGGGSRQFLSMQQIKESLGLSKGQNDLALIDLYNSVPELAAPIDYIATQAAMMNHKFVKRLSNGKEKDISLPEWEKLLANPNPFQNNSKFWKMIHIQYLLQGNVYINPIEGIGTRILKGTPDYLFLLPPQHIDIILEQMQYDQVDPNADFRFNMISGYQLKYGNKFKKIIPKEEIIHISDSQASFENGKYVKGHSCAYRGIMATKSIKAGYEAKVAFYENRGMMGLFVNNDPDGVRLNPKDKEDLLNNLKRKFGIKEGQHLFDYVNHNVNYLNVSPDFSGLQINENNEADTRAICKAIKGFPPSLIMDNRISTLNNTGSEISQKEKDRRLFKNIVLPIDYDICEAFSRGAGLADENIWYVPDLSTIEALKPDLKADADLSEVVSSGISEVLSLYNKNELSYNQAYYLLTDKWKVEEAKAKEILNDKPENNE